MEFWNARRKQDGNFRAIYPKQAWALKHNLARFKHDVFDAESVHQVTQRMVDFIQSLQEENLETVLIVSHGAFLTASIHRLLGFHQPNCVTEVVWIMHRLLF